MRSLGLIKEVAKEKAYVVAGSSLATGLTGVAIKTEKHIITLGALAVTSFALGAGFQLWTDKLESDRLVVLEELKREKRRSVVRAWRKRK